MGHNYAGHTLGPTRSQNRDHVGPPSLGRTDWATKSVPTETYRTGLGWRPPSEGCQVADLQTPRAVGQCDHHERVTSDQVVTSDAVTCSDVRPAGLHITPSRRRCVA
jgi:hypothetical protein